MRASTATWLGAVALLRAGMCAAAATTTTTTDARFANYAFASELGSGIYEISGRTIQVYQLQPSYSLREPSPRGGRPGIRLIFPVTVGFFNFQPDDLLHLHIPTQIGALSLEPGVQLDFWLSDAWHVYPYLKGGGTFASSAQINSVLYGVGVRSDYRFAVSAGTGLWRAELAHAGVHYQGDLPNDSFTRLRDGVELRHTFEWPSPRRSAQLGIYGMTDVYFDAPAGPASGIAARTVQFEGGLMFSASPMWQVKRFTLPRIGIGYRVAGVLSGWHLVIGEPF